MPAPPDRQRMPAPPSPTRPALRFREIAFSFEPPVPGLSMESLPGLARFGCDLSATVGGIPSFGQTSQNRGSGNCDTDEKRGPGSMRRSIVAALGQGEGLAPRPARAAFIN